MNFLFILATYLLVSSCYVYSPEYNYRFALINDSNNEHTTLGTTDIKPVAPLKVVTAGCKPGDFTALGAIPKPPSEAEINSAASQKDIDLLLVKYIKELRLYIDRQNYAISAYVAKLKDEC